MPELLRPVEGVTKPPRLPSPMAAYRVAVRAARERRARLDTPAPERAPQDWRTDAQRRHDARLVGSHWRCRVHGVRDDFYVLGGHSYCDEESCTLPVLLVSVVHATDEERATRQRPWLAIALSAPPVIVRADGDVACWVGSCDVVTPAGEPHVAGLRGDVTVRWCMGCAMLSTLDEVRALAAGVR